MVLTTPHSLFWIPVAPPLDRETDKCTDEWRAEWQAEFAQYWGIKITAWNPDQSRLPDARNPTSLALVDVANTAD